MADAKTIPIRLVIADDHPVVRTGIVGMLAGQADFLIVGEASDGEGVLQLVQARQPDVVLMDLRMPKMDGVRTTRHIRQHFPQTHVLILTTFDSDGDIVAALDAGATGYLLKDTPPADLHQAIRQAAVGKMALGAPISARLVTHVRGSAHELSARELDVLRAVGRGQTNKQIAHQLHISEATVKTHLRHIYEKLAANDRAEAIAKAIKAGWLHPDEL